VALFIEFLKKHNPDVQIVGQGMAEAWRGRLYNEHHCDDVSETGCRILTAIGDWILARS